MMIDPAVKTAMAFCVLLGGVCAAFLIGRDPARPTERPATAIHGKKASGVLSGERRRARRNSRLEGEYSSYPRPAENVNRSPTLLTPAETGQPPPLSEDYPQPEPSTDSSWGRSMDSMLPFPARTEPQPTTHKIVDGDTLAALAERYLGSPDRAGEIFAANRDVLMDPELLPIGVELKIPPK